MTVTRNPAVPPVSNPALATCGSRLSGVQNLGHARKKPTGTVVSCHWVFLPLLCLYLVACNYLNGVPVN